MEPCGKYSRKNGAPDCASKRPVESNMCQARASSSYAPEVEKKVTGMHGNMKAIEQSKGKVLFELSETGLEHLVV